MIKQSLHRSVTRANDGRKLDHTTLEALRMQAVPQAEGEHPEVLAAALG